ncbi:MAG TPA: tRNA preQ1(34) S-adenosylmethionine ribosyltransferase-isomerase QueA [Terriglobales bacterium]|jgi:S-adenosylmethionine:tRNA ribosyltransferase-isomerase|nr:tRNA preQ1(34) S-adenosylmethionine ribosyltransferase-isomerase QueA [Terriglobales bacterium]
MLVSDFHYDLPPELIAQEPLADRAASRLLHLERSTGALADRRFRDLPGLLRPGDLVVFNNTRVFPARLYGRRAGLRAQSLSPRNPASRDFLRGRVEVLLTSPCHPEERSDEGSAASLKGRGFSRADKAQDDEGALAPEGNPLTWRALVRPGRKLGVGERLFFGEDDELQAEILARGDFGERILRFHPVPDLFALLERLGHVPLPPYIARPDQPADRERYQTVYARERGSVAAPTAGLHFTPEILTEMRSRGIETAEITLHVGLGTFQPVHVERVEEHKMHREWFQLAPAAAQAIERAREAGRRIVAVGTTTVRTLEYAALQSPEGRIAPMTGAADLFIYPGFRFRVVGALVTNFHLPQSTLLMLVAAFAGRERILAAYAHAVRERYRFYSYGDCMLIE